MCERTLLKALFSHVTSCPLWRGSLLSALWLSDWSSPSFQQLPGVTQTCATKSLGMVWRVPGCLEGNGSSGWHLTLHRANPLCSLWRSHGWGCFCVGSTGLPGSESLFDLLENDISLYSAAPLPACGFLPVGQSFFPV